MTVDVTEQTSISLSVVIPAYNEAERLPKYLATVVSCLASFGAAAEIIVVDDGSFDETAAAAGRVAAAPGMVRIIRLPRNMGKGYAVKTGMLAARGRMYRRNSGISPKKQIMVELRHCSRRSSNQVSTAHAGAA